MSFLFSETLWAVVYSQGAKAAKASSAFFSFQPQDQRIIPEVRGHHHNVSKYRLAWSSDDLQYVDSKILQSVLKVTEERMQQAATGKCYLVNVSMLTYLTKMGNMVTIINSKHRLHGCRPKAPLQALDKSTERFFQIIMLKQESDF